jgi:hypothetical protein
MLGIDVCLLKKIIKGLNKTRVYKFNKNFTFFFAPLHSLLCRVGLLSGGIAAEV